MAPPGPDNRPVTDGTSLRVALVGYGLGGAAFHAPLIATTPAMTLAGVVTRNPARIADVRSRYPACRILSGAEELLADADAWDLVVVATPNATHVPLATRGRRCRPAVRGRQAGRDGCRVGHGCWVAPRRRAACSLVPFHNRRWDGDFLTILELIAAGRLGEPHRVESRFERWRPTVGPQTGWRDDPHAGGGVLDDLGPHLVDQALVLWGRPSSVYAELDVRRAGATSVDDAFVALSWPDGRRAHLWASAIAAAPGPRFRVLGSRAAYVKWGMDPQEALLRAGAVPAGPDWGADAEEAWGRVGEEAVPTVHGAYPWFYAAMVAHLRDGGPAPVAWEDAVVGLEVIDAARRSAADGSVVAV